MPLLKLVCLRSLVFQNAVALLLFTHSCAGQSQVIGPSQPIVAFVGDDVILPCHLEPAEDVSHMTVEWARFDLDPRFVHVRRAGLELQDKKHPSYRGRTSLFTDELKHGNVSLKLSNVKISDNGNYRCLVPELGHALVQLVVGAVSSPYVHIAKIIGGVLQCESSGWYPEPEVLWLDSEGNLLSAGPPETVRGPDDLYTVSSRVTVEKRHSNSFTCRVQQKDTRQTREAHIHVPDDFLSCFGPPVVIGLAVALSICILFILAGVVFAVLRKCKQKQTQANVDHEAENPATSPKSPESQALMVHKGSVRNSVKGKGTDHRDKKPQKTTEPGTKRGSTAVKNTEPRVSKESQKAEKGQNASAIRENPKERDPWKL